MLSLFHLMVGLLDCYRNDEILADVEFIRFSMDPGM